MTAGYRESEGDGSAGTSTGRPGPLPPRSEHTGALPGPVWPSPADAQGQVHPPAAPYPATSSYPAAVPSQPAPAHDQAPVATHPGYPVSAAPGFGYPVSGAPVAGVSGIPAQAGGTVPSGPPAPGAWSPAPPARRSPLVTALLIVLVVLAVGQGVGLVLLGTSLSDERSSRHSAQAADAKRISDLESRAAALEKQAAASLDPQAVAAAVLPSVFKVEAGNFSGTAFVIAASGSSSSLFTNYHVVADLYEGGGRTVSLVHDNQRFSAKITKVDTDNDVALLTTNDKFPALAAVKQDIATGAPVVVVGAPLGLAQTVTTGVVSAIRSDVPGEAGRKLIQFSAPINPGNSGGPVVDAQKEVVGIATAKAQNAEGIGLAVPISVACRSMGVC
jgi:putative serine protease PepD